ncbi:HetZ-related protein 2 [Nodosilinea sp. E11]|uniref:HetZ-related protein 2 n=1 Tax=Nodosilinea sp. E11 TaxID=3037479 RepID=UPI0029351701|nr:HetZ-related protein 2 [Nodosilinea sp. E11]WOD41837.1 HetZ-related protein 2 [Nodosilinea sp. E11]
MVAVDTMTEDWLSRLRAELPDQPQSVCQSIVYWLLGESPERFETLTDTDLAIARQAIEYRYRIFQQRYWNVSPEQGYQRLIKRLSSLFLIRSKVKTWIALSRDRRRTVVDVIQEVIQEMMRSDRHLAQQLKWISACTQNSRLRNLLMLASIEEYCLRPIRHQPLIIYRFVNYLRRSQKGGMTQVPTGELIRLVSDEIAPSDSEDSLSLLDVEAWSQYQEQQTELEQQSMRHQVKTSFTNYLSRNLDDTAARWLELHLTGLSQEQIAQTLEMPVQQVYRLREKISYHAVRIFALREQPDMVLGWLKTSLQEHNFGLTPTQWDQFWQSLSAEEQAILTAYKDEQPLEELTQRLGLKNRQIQAQWVQLYLRAQELRTQSESS